MQDDLSLAVSKRLDADGYKYPSVRIRLTAYGDGPVAVRLAESLPQGVDATAVGFHADEGYQHWSVAGEGRIVYEDVVDAGETVSTLYGVTDADAAELSACLDEPTVQVARRGDLDAVGPDEWRTVGDGRLELSVPDDSPDPDRQNSPRDGDWGDSNTTMNEDDPNDRGEQRDRTERDERAEPTGGDGRTEPTDEDGPDGSTDGDDEASVLYRGGSAARETGEPAAPSAAVTEGQPDGATAGDGQSDGTVAGDDHPESATTGDDQQDGTTSDGQWPDAAPGDDRSDGSASGDRPDGNAGEGEPDGVAGTGSVADRVAAELRRDEASAQTVATLRRHLTPDRPGTVEAKLDHCMTRIGELDAYVDALEEFLDDEGTAEQLLAEVREDLQRVEARTEDVARRVEAVEAAQSRLDDRLAAVESELDDLDEEVESVDELSASVEELDAGLSETRAELTDAVEAVESDVSRLDDDVESIEEWRSTVVTALSDAETDPSDAD
ncbi:hypothetical protein [Halosimplex halobium]|uniref:hypothetical protein n=1 Tax=Halosimplex halobium TaxID=3396618 RepID=UPI003F56E0D5